LDGGRSGEVPIYIGGARERRPGSRPSLPWDLWDSRGEEGAMKAWTDRVRTEMGEENRNWARMKYVVYRWASPGSGAVKAGRALETPQEDLD